MTTRKIDGWIAQSGDLPYLFDFYKIEEKEAALEDYEDCLNFRIKPVCFIDPAEYDRLEAVEKWAKDARGYVETMRNIQGTKQFIQNQQVGVDFEVEDGLLTEFDKLLTNQQEPS